MSPLRWWRRLVGGVAAFAVLELLLTLIDAGPEPLRLALLVATCVAVLGLILDALSHPGPSWQVDVEEPASAARPDPRLGRYVSLLEAHLSARSNDTALRDRLRSLAVGVVSQRYDVARDDPSVPARLGPELVSVLEGPPRRLDPAEIERVLARIEQL